MRQFIARCFLFLVLLSITAHGSEVLSSVSQNVDDKTESTSRFALYNYPLRDFLGDWILASDIPVSQKFTLGPSAIFQYRTENGQKSGSGFGGGIQGSFFPKGADQNSLYVTLAGRASSIGYKDDSFWVSRKKSFVESEVAIGKQWVWKTPFLRVGLHWIHQSITDKRDYISYNGVRTNDDAKSVENPIGINFAAGCWF